MNTENTNWVMCPSKSRSFYFNMSTGATSSNIDQPSTSRSVSQSQNFVSVQTSQSKKAKIEKLFTQSRWTNDDSALSKSLKTNSDSNTINEFKNVMNGLNLDEQTYLNIEGKLRELCLNYEGIEIHVAIVRVDEWICIFLQIMEEFLIDIFQVTKDTKFEPPYWFLQGMERFKQVFSQYKSLCAIISLMLSMCEYCIKNGVLRIDIKSNQFIKILYCGILLIEESVKFIRYVHVLEYRDMLQQLIASIFNCKPEVIDGARSGTNRNNEKQVDDNGGGVTNASSTAGVSQTQPMSKNVTYTNDPDYILELNDDRLSNDRFNTGLIVANHKETLITNNTLQVNNNFQNTDNIQRKSDLKENDVNAHEDPNSRNNDDTRLTGNPSGLTEDFKNTNDKSEGQNSKMIVEGKKDNQSQVDLISKSTLKGNNHGINGKIEQAKKAAVVHAVDDNDIKPSVKLFIAKIKIAFKMLRKHCVNSLAEFAIGNVTLHRKELIRKKTNELLAILIDIIPELQRVDKKNESKCSHVQKQVGGASHKYKMYIKECLSEGLTAKQSLEHVLETLNTL